MSIIYALLDPRTGEVRYVGKTAGSLAERMRGHLRAARRGERRHSARWIRGLVLRGLTPTVRILETVDEDWAARERYWIARFRSVGARLTNLTEGGDGGAGRVVDAEERAARAASWTAERRAAQAARKRGVPASSEAIAKRTAALREPECRARRSASARRRWASGAYASRGPRSERRAAIAFLAAELADGPRLIAELKEEGTAQGLGRYVLQQARKDLGAVVVYAGPTGARSWRLAHVI